MKKRTKQNKSSPDISIAKEFISAIKLAHQNVSETITQCLALKPVPTVNSTTTNQQPMLFKNLMVLVVFIADIIGIAHLIMFWDGGASSWGLLATLVIPTLFILIYAGITSKEVSYERRQQARSNRLSQYLSLRETRRKLPPYLTALKALPFLAATAGIGSYVFLYVSKGEWALFSLYLTILLLVTGAHVVFLINAKDIYRSLTGKYERFKNRKARKQAQRLESVFARQWQELVTMYAEFKTHFADIAYTPILSKHEKDFVREFYGVDDFSFNIPESLMVFSHNSRVNGSKRNAKKTTFNNGKATQAVTHT